jgi:hypothetical protein
MKKKIDKLSDLIGKRIKLVDVDADNSVITFTFAGDEKVAFSAVGETISVSKLRMETEVKIKVVTEQLGM